MPALLALIALPVDFDRAQVLSALLVEAFSGSVFGKASAARNRRARGRASWRSEQALRHMIGRDSYALPGFKEANDMRCRTLAVITTLTCLSYAGAGDAVAFSPQSHFAIPLVHRILPVKCTDAQKAACDKLWTDETYRKCISMPEPRSPQDRPPCFSPRMACYQRCGGS